MALSNPFFHRGPIRDPAYFFGRSHELGQALNLLQGGQCVSIVGPRRIGKTSFLLHLARPAVLQAAGLDPDQFVFAYVDCESCGQLTQAELLGRFAHEFRRALSDQPASEAADALSYQQFADLLRAVCDQGRQPVFLLDEFDTLSENPYLEPHFFAGLRALANSFGVIYVTISTRPLIELSFTEKRTLSSPFFNIFAQLRLRLFAMHEAAQMADELARRAGFCFGDEDIRWLIDLAGPHALLLQIAAYHLFDHYARASASLEETAQSLVGERFVADAEMHWTYFWQSLPTSDRRMLVLLPVIWRTDPQSVQRLLNAGLIVRQDGEIRTFSSAFQSFVQRQQVPGLLQAPPITLDPVRRIALLRGEVLALPPAEFELLAYLLARAGQVVPSTEIEAHVWKDAEAVGEERLKSTIRNLRRLLDEDATCLQNVRGVGYLFAGTPD